MLHPVELNKLALDRTQEMIAESLARHQFKIIRKSDQNSPIKAIGCLFISLGYKLKGEATIEPRPALNLK